MNWRFKLGAVTVALLAGSLAGTAHAALVDGAGGNGSLILFAWDESQAAGNQRAYVQILGGNSFNTFNASGARISNAGFSQQFNLDPLFFTAFASSTAANIKW